MKLENLNEATTAVNTVMQIPLEPRLRLGLVHAEVALRAVRAVAFSAAQAKLDNTMDDATKQELMEQLWDELIDA